jgi:hypothetical protein
MFYKTESGRLQNLTLLQDVIVTKDDIDNTKYSVGYLQINGEIIKEGTYNTELEVESKIDSIRASLLD